MTVKLNVRVTSKSKCREGFYLQVNGIRLHFRTRALALRSVTDWLALQRLQICTVREYAARNRKKISARMPCDIGASKESSPTTWFEPLEGVALKKSPAQIER